MYNHIKNFKSYKGKLWNKSINDLAIEENRLIDLKIELDEKLELITDIIRMKENERSV
jgi:hypothetical protein